MRVVLSGGGTAGHIYPALTIAAHVAAEHDEVVFVGTPQGLEARLVPEAGVAFQPLPSQGFNRSKPWTLVTAAFRVVGSTVKAWRFFREWKPDVVIGFGAYVALPVGLAAVLTRTPLVLHEQNSVPGLANKVLSRWADAVAVTYEESAKYFRHPDRIALTGNPVREAVLAADRANGRDYLELAEDDKVLLVFGGSLGARHINKALVALHDELMAIDGLVVIHVPGRADAPDVRAALASRPGYDASRWRVLDYLDRMGDAIAASDVVICRAGATTIAEITVLGAPAVLVPFPYATEDHQTKNAAALAEHGAAIVVADEDLDGPSFAGAVTGLLGDASRRATMSAASRALGRPDAAARVVAVAHDAIARRTHRR